MEGQIDAFAQLHRQFVDRTQWRYEVIRPVVLLADRTPQQRARETQTHSATVRKLTRRFRQQGMLGLLPDTVEVSVRGKATVSPAMAAHVHALSGHDDLDRRANQPGRLDGGDL